MNTKPSLHIEWIEEEEKGKAMNDDSLYECHQLTILHRPEINEKIENRFVER